MFTRLNLTVVKASFKILFFSRVGLVYTIYICYCIYMAKKYLLYIHDEKFNEEKEKSKLVNTLLGKHYGGTYDLKPSGTVYVSPKVKQNITEINPEDEQDCPRHHVRKKICRHRH